MITEGFGVLGDHAQIHIEVDPGWPGLSDAPGLFGAVR
jgi:hypothetical protein